MEKQTILQNFPQWEKLQNELDDDPYDSKSWEDLITHHEKLINDHLSLIQTKSEMKLLIYQDFDKLITKFPFLVNYWKKYVTVVYTIDGLNCSINILERAVKLFPSSLELWIDYVNILIINNLKGENEMIKIFLQASENIGRQFMSHEFWDIYLSWVDNKFGKNSNDYIKILLQVINVPLYEYAKYFEDFIALKDKFDIFDLIDIEVLKKIVMEKYPNENFKECIENNGFQIIENYFNENFSVIENGTNERWQFESKITKFEFDLSLTSDTELQSWLSYLNYEESQGNSDQIISLYERAIVPTCFNDTIWIKYARYLIQNNKNKELVLNVFNRACNQFVPIELKKIRYMYAKYYELKLKDLANAKKIYYSIIKENLTDCDPIDRFIEFLFDTTESKEEVLSDLTSCIHLYNRENYSNQKKRKVTNKVEHFDIKSNDFKELYKLLNYRTIGQLIVNISKYYWLELNEIRTTRDILVQFFKTDLVKPCREYWFFFHKFEVCQRNKKNLTNIINYIKYFSELNVKDINLLINEYVGFMIKNNSILELDNSKRDLVKYWLETDFESSTHMKHFLKSRIDKNNDEEITNKRLVRENGHPAAVSEGRPTLINPIPVVTNTFTIEKAYPLPQFRNVEKANINVKYVHESI